MEWKNRDGDIYTFKLQDDGSILWEGEFKYYRVGYPNAYKKAYQTYCKDVGSKGEYPMHIETFIERVHEQAYGNGQWVGLSEIGLRYRHLVVPNTDTIDMIDPSGGPCIKVHQELGWLGEEFKDLCVSTITPIETGYRIGTYGKYDHLADTKIIGGIINTSE